MKPTGVLWVSAAVAALFVPAGAWAANDIGSLGAGIRFERYQTDFDIGPATYTGRVNEAGLSLRQYFGRNFSLAMEVGYLDISYDGNPAARNFSPSGAYGRITARYQWRLVRHLGFDFTGTAAYHRLSNSNSTGTYAARWWAYSLAAGPRFSSGWFSVAGGAVYRDASGTEESPSAGDQPLSFARTANPYLDFDFTVTTDGTFGVHLQGGARQSAALVFGYRFVSP